MDASHLFVIGLTGGVGSGKSTAANFLETLGATLIDADLIAHRLTAAEGGAIAAIRATFGDEMIDAGGAMNRQLMREKAFTDPSTKARLEAILHPLICIEISRALASLKASGTRSPPNGARPDHGPVYVVLVLPLLFETNSYARMLHRILVIDCAEARQIRQVVQRSALSVDEVRRIMAVQVPRALRLQLADDVVCNMDTTAVLHTAVRALHVRYCAFALQRADRSAAM